MGWVDSLKLLEGHWLKEGGHGPSRRPQMGKWSPLSHIPSTKTSSLCCYR